MSKRKVGEVKKKAGRIGKYENWITEEGIALIAGWARDGLTDEMIAKNMGISRSTLYEWRNRFSDISNALKKGKEVVDRFVENAMLKNATGYEYIEEVPMKTKRVFWDEDNHRCEQEEVVVVPVKKYQPPNVTAGIFWLTNRMNSKWRQRADAATNDEEISKVDQILKGLTDAAQQ